MVTATPAVVAGAPAAPPALGTSGIRSRAVAAALACTARHGIAKTTLDDVAREAGCARATLYRHIGGKGELVALTVAAEGERIGASLRAAAAAEATLEDAVVAVVHRAAGELAGHQALAFLVAFEPEHVLPFVTFDGGDRLMALARHALTPCFTRFLPGEEAERLAEWVARVTLAYVCPPASPLDLRDEPTVRELVSSFVVPGFLPVTRSTRG
jgi:AcrR family transcriptional regulator